MLLGAAKLLKETFSTSQPGTVPWKEKGPPTCVVVFFVHGNIDVSLIEFGGLVHFSLFLICLVVCFWLLCCYFVCLFVCLFVCFIDFFCLQTERLGGGQILFWDTQNPQDPAMMNPTK